jgi:phage recombination protein Bet
MSKNELALIAQHYELSIDDVTLIKDVICKGASLPELRLFLYQCKRTRLDPLSRQAYWARQFQVTVDGERLIAERTGKYEGQTKPEWCGKDGKWRDVWLHDEPPAGARVGVHRTNFREPCYATALYREYVQNTPIWKKGPALMLAKCAESLALRKAFPNELSGVYSHEEMGNVPLEEMKEAVEAYENNVKENEQARANATPESMKETYSALYNEAKDAASKGEATFLAFYRDAEADEKRWLRAWKDELTALYPVPA